MSSIKQREQRVGVFMEVPNLYHSAKNLYRSKVNFKEVLKTAVAGRHLIRAIAYAIKTESGEERAFLEALKKSGIETKVKDLQVFPGGIKKGNWDVGISIDTIKMGGRLDVIVLITGDGDFIPLVEYLKVRFGCRVEVVAFGRSASGKLREIADDFVDLEETPEKYLLKK